MCSGPQYTGLVYMGGTRSSGPMRIIFDSVIMSWYTSIKFVSIKFGANRTFHVPKIRVYRFCLYGRYQVLWTDIAHFQYRPAYSQEAYLQSLKFEAICVRTQSLSLRADRRTDRHSSNVLEFGADQMFPSKIGSQIIISRCYKRIDKTNIPFLRRV